MLAVHQLTKPADVGEGASVLNILVTLRHAPGMTRAMKFGETI
jgi:hypothetical protein